MDHAKSKSASSYHHYLIEKYLTKLYYTDEEILRPCTANPAPRSERDNTIIRNVVNRIDIISYMCIKITPPSVYGFVLATSSFGSSSKSGNYKWTTIPQTIDVDIEQVYKYLQEILTCPITHEIFQDLVMAQDGATYDRTARRMINHQWQV